MVMAACNMHMPRHPALHLMNSERGSEYHA